MSKRYSTVICQECNKPIEPQMRKTQNGKVLDTPGQHRQRVAHPGKCMRQRQNRYFRDYRKTAKGLVVESDESKPKEKKLRPNTICEQWLQAHAQKIGWNVDELRGVIQELQNGIFNHLDLYNYLGKDNDQLQTIHITGWEDG